MAQNRRSRRSQVFLQAMLDVAGASVPVVLRNLSCDGALVSGKELPEPGKPVLFHRQGLSVPSSVAWSHRGYAGIHFDSPLFPKELLRHIPATENKPPPDIKRRPGLAPQPLTPSERLILERWATESSFSLGG